MSEQKTSFKISELLQQAKLNLKQAGIETAALEARVLLCHVCRITEVEVIACPDQLIEEQPAAEYFNLVARRSQRIPLAHLLGTREFWGLEFHVNAHTLIPRPETEFAVESAIMCARRIFKQTGQARILDMGTGTGCLLISILHEVEGASGIGIDIDAKAVELAEKNAEKLGVEVRASFRCMDWGDGLTETFDIIVTNPPYIRSEDLAGLMPEVAEHEPARALDGGPDGLDEYRKIIPPAHRLLNRQGVLILEIGDGQAGDVLGLLAKNDFHPLDGAQPVKHDLAGCERIITAVKVC